MKRVLLLVDDEADLGELFERLLAPSFDEVYFATDRVAADLLLARGEVTHLVVDSALDHKGTRGQDLICAWRRAHPTIRYAALFTGRNLAKEQLPAEVDEVFSKPEGLEDLVARLRSK